MPARIVVVGAGAAGLATAYACATAGCEVSIVEQDPLELPDDADTAFDRWPRAGVPQLRHSHAFLPRFVALLRDRAPQLLEALLAAGARRLTLDDLRPVEMDGFTREPGDDDLTALGCRRTTVEWVLRREVEALPPVSITRAHVDGLLVDGARVRGVHTTDGRGVEGDLVVDASGTRSALPDWLDAAGLAAPVDRITPTGIVYTTRFYRRDPAEITPLLHQPLGDELEHLTYGIYPGDNATFSLTLVVPASDRASRSALASDDAFDTTARSLPYAREWVVGAEPLSAVRVMANLSNRVRTDPLLDGLAVLGDAAIVANPLYGAGCTLACTQGFVLADLVSDGGDVTRRFASYKRAEIEPWHDDAVERDRIARDPESARLREFLRRGVRRAIRTDPVVWRAALRVVNLLDPPDVMQQPEIAQRVLTAWAASPSAGHD